MYHYIIVGFGIAGYSFSQILEENRRNFIVFDNQSQQSTRIAGGMYNPIILKRFTPAWKAAEMLPYALLQFQKSELKFGKKYIFPIKIYRKLASIEEQNNWAVASDKPVMRDFMLPVSFEKIDGIESPYGFGILKNTGIVNVSQLLDDAKKELKRKKLLIEEEFQYKNLNIYPDYVEYQGIKARCIIFAEGYGLKKNPYFNSLPLMGTKGEMLLIKTEAQIPYIVKSNVFLAPDVSQKGQYYVGATYNWEDKSNIPTQEAKEHLENKLQQLFNKDYKVVLQKAGIRPTVKDRRPLVGTHPEYKNLAVLNGMGTRGVILAPNIAKYLYNYLEFEQKLPPEIDIKRFDI